MIESDKKRLTLISIHAGVWILLFALPFIMFQSGQFQPDSKFLLHYWIPLLQNGIIFYLNYLFLLPRYFSKEKAYWLVLVNLGIIAFFLFLNFQLREVLFHAHEKMPPPPVPGGHEVRKFQPPPGNFFLLKDFLSFLLPIVLAIALKATENWKRTENERIKAENKHLESELQHLKYQLQPHFFFNSLNNIYSLVEVSPEQAREAIHNLSGLMRYLLYDTGKDLVALTDEIRFLKKFIGLMELRQGNNTVIASHFPEEVEENLQIAPLLFIPLIENAFKHGISSGKHSHILVQMLVNGGEVEFHIRNDNFPKSEEDKSGSGIGLPNLLKRLELLYPGKYRIEHGVVGNQFMVTLRINLIR